MAARTPAHLVEPYLRGRLARHEIGRLTARNDRCILRHFAAVVGPVPVASLDAHHVRKWLGSLERLAPATRRRRFATVRTFCGWLVETRLVDRNPMVGLRSPRQPRAVPRAMPLADVVATVAACPDARARFVVLAMVQLGLRCCEVANLQVGDVDRVGGHVRVRGKGGHERILPLLGEVADALEEYLALWPAFAGPLVRSYREPQRALDADTISGLVAGWMADAGVKRSARDGVSAHALRHTAATDMLRGGAHVRDVQQALGHAHLATTEVYMPLVVRGLELAMAGRQYGGHARPVVVSIPSTG